MHRCRIASAVLLLGAQIILQGCDRQPQQRLELPAEQQKLTTPRDGQQITTPRERKRRVASSELSKPEPSSDAAKPLQKRETYQKGVVTAASVGVFGACEQIATTPGPQRLAVAVDHSSIFIHPQVLQTPLKVLAKGLVLTVAGTEGQWYLIRFEDERLGPRAGYIHCSNVVVADPPEPRSPSIAALSATSAPPPRNTRTMELDEIMLGRATNQTPPNKRTMELDEIALGRETKTNQTQVVDKRGRRLVAKPESLAGYVEWSRNGYLIADGQRVRWNAETRLKLRGIGSVLRIPLGYEINVKGTRTSDGSLLATILEAKPNGVAAFELETLKGSDGVEAAWARNGAIFHFDRSGRRVEDARVLNSGPDVERIDRIVRRLIPPYVDRGRLRIHVIQTSDWNAFAMANGSIWVNKGLLADLSDDELAIALGHELTHFTHEHSRRTMRTGMLARFAGELANAFAQSINNSAVAATAIGANLSLATWQNHYGRTLEDQADRVGLRYAYEAGFDVWQAPRMWRRVLERSGQMDRVSNFFLGDHSRTSDRIRNIERELNLNYQQSKKP
jgi:Zn-dependent protease with chaperone function